MAIMPVINLKGGVAKTTSSVAIAETFASQGDKVLLIDADHQCTAGELLLGESRMMRCEKRKKTLHDLLVTMLDDDFNANQLETFIENNGSNINGGLENLSVLPCSIRIDDFSTNVQKAKKGYHSNNEFASIFAKRRNLFRNWLNQNFDHVIIDCPPSVALQVKVLLVVADAYIIPSIPDNLSIRGCVNLIDRIRRTGIKRKPLGILWSLFRKQDKVHCENIHNAKNRQGVFATLPKPFEFVIPNTTAISQAIQNTKSVKSHAAKYGSRDSILFRRLCGEISKRLNYTKTIVPNKTTALPVPPKQMVPGR